MPDPINNPLQKIVGTMGDILGSTPVGAVAKESGKLFVNSAMNLLQSMSQALEGTDRTEMQKEINNIAKNLYEYIDNHSASLGDAEFDKQLKRITTDNVVGVLEKFKRKSGGQSLIKMIVDESGSDDREAEISLLGGGDGKTTVRGVFVLLLEQAVAVGVDVKTANSFLYDFKKEFNRICKERGGWPYIARGEADKLDEITNNVINLIKLHVQAMQEPATHTAPEPASQTQRKAIDNIQRRYEQAKKDYETQKKTEGWAAAVADVWGKYFSTNGNYEEAVEADLRIAEKDLERLNAALEKGEESFKDMFYRVFEVGYDAVALKNYENQEARYIIALQATQNEENFNQKFSKLLNSSVLLEETRSMYSPSSNTVQSYTVATKQQVYDRDFAELAKIFDTVVSDDKTGQYEALGIKNGRDFLNKTIESAGKKDASIDEKYKVLRSIAKEISGNLKTAKETACGGSSLTKIKQQYDNAYKAAYGLHNDIMKRITEYNISQQKGAGIVKGIAPVIGAIAIGMLTGGLGAAAVAGAGGGTAAAGGGAAALSSVLQGAGIVGGLTFLAETSDRLSSSNGMSLEDFGVAVKAGLVSGSMCLMFGGQSYVINNLVVKGATAAGMSQVAAGYTAAIANGAGIVGTGLGTEYLLTGEISTEGAAFTVVMALTATGLQIMQVNKMAAAMPETAEARFNREFTNSKQILGISDETTITEEYLNQLERNLKHSQLSKLAHPDTGLSPEAIGLPEGTTLTEDVAALYKMGYQSIYQSNLDAIGFLRKVVQNGAMLTPQVQPSLPGTMTLGKANPETGINPEAAQTSKPTVPARSGKPITPAAQQGASAQPLGTPITPPETQAPTKPLGTPITTPAAQTPTKPLGTPITTPAAQTPTQPLGTPLTVPKPTPANVPAAEYTPIVPVENNLTNTEIISIYEKIDNVNQLIDEYRHIEGAKYPIHRAILEDIIEQRTGMDIDEVLAATQNGGMLLVEQPSATVVPLSNGAQTVPLNQPTVGAMAAAGSGSGVRIPVTGGAAPVAGELVSDVVARATSQQGVKLSATVPNLKGGTVDIYTNAEGKPVLNVVKDPSGHVVHTIEATYGGNNSVSVTETFEGMGTPLNQEIQQVISDTEANTVRYSEPVTQGNAKITYGYDANGNTTQTIIQQGSTRTVVSTSGTSSIQQTSVNGKIINNYLVNGGKTGVYTDANGMIITEETANNALTEAVTQAAASDGKASEVAPHAGTTGKKSYTKPKLEVISLELQDAINSSLSDDIAAGKAPVGGGDTSVVSDGAAVTVENFEQGVLGNGYTKNPDSRGLLSRALGKLFGGSQTTSYTSVDGNTWIGVAYDKTGQISQIKVVNTQTKQGATVEVANTASIGQLRNPDNGIQTLVDRVANPDNAGTGKVQRENVHLGSGFKETVATPDGTVEATLKDGNGNTILKSKTTADGKVNVAESVYSDMTPQQLIEELYAAVNGDGDALSFEAIKTELQGRGYSVEYKDGNIEVVLPKADFEQSAASPQSSQTQHVSQKFLDKFANCKSIEDTEMLVTQAETSAECDYIANQLEKMYAQADEVSKPQIKAAIDLAKFRAERLSVDEQSGVSKEFRTKFAECKSVNDLERLVGEAETSAECDYVVEQLEKTSTQINRTRVQEVIDLAKFRAERLRVDEQSNVSNQFRTKFAACNSINDVKLLVTEAGTSAECDYIVAKLKATYSQPGAVNKSQIQEVIDLAQFRADRLRADEQKAQVQTSQPQLSQQGSVTGGAATVDISNPVINGVDVNKTIANVKSQIVTTESETNGKITKTYGKDKNGQTVTITTSSGVLDDVVYNDGDITVRQMRVNDEVVGTIVIVGDDEVFVNSQGEIVTEDAFYDAVDFATDTAFPKTDTVSNSQIVINGVDVNNTIANVNANVVSSNTDIVGTTTVINGKNADGQIIKTVINNGVVESTQYIDGTNTVTQVSVNGNVVAHYVSKDGSMGTYTDAQGLIIDETKYNELIKAAVSDAETSTGDLTVVPSENQQSAQNYKPILETGIGHSSAKLDEIYGQVEDLNALIQEFNHFANDPKRVVTCATISGIINQRAEAAVANAQAKVVTTDTNTENGVTEVYGKDSDGNIVTTAVKNGIIEQTTYIDGATYVATTTVDGKVVGSYITGGGENGVYVDSKGTIISEEAFAENTQAALTEAYSKLPASQGTPMTEGSATGGAATVQPSDALVDAYELEADPWRGKSKGWEYNILEEVRTQEDLQYIIDNASADFKPEEAQSLIGKAQARLDYLNQTEGNPIVPRTANPDATAALESVAPKVTEGRISSDAPLGEGYTISTVSRRGRIQYNVHSVEINSHNEPVTSLVYNQNGSLNWAKNQYTDGAGNQVVETYDSGHLIGSNGMSTDHPWFSVDYQVRVTSPDGSVTTTTYNLETGDKLVRTYTPAENGGEPTRTFDRSVISPEEQQELRTHLSTLQAPQVISDAQNFVPKQENVYNVVKRVSSQEGVKLAQIADRPTGGTIQNYTDANGHLVLTVFKSPYTTSGSQIQMTIETINNEQGFPIKSIETYADGSTVTSTFAGDSEFPTRLSRVEKDANGNVINNPAQQQTVPPSSEVTSEMATTPGDIVTALQNAASDTQALIDLCNSRPVEVKENITYKQIEELCKTPEGLAKARELGIVVAKGDIAPENIRTGVPASESTVIRLDLSGTPTEVMARYPDIITKYNSETGEYIIPTNSGEIKIKPHESGNFLEQYGDNPLSRAHNIGTELLATHTMNGGQPVDLSAIGDEPVTLVKSKGQKQFVVKTDGAKATWNKNEGLQPLDDKVVAIDSEGEVYPNGVDFVLKNTTGLDNQTLIELCEANPQAVKENISPAQIQELCKTPEGLAKAKELGLVQQDTNTKAKPLSEAAKPTAADITPMQADTGITPLGEISVEDAQRPLMYYMVRNGLRLQKGDRLWGDSKNPENTNIYTNSKGQVVREVSFDKGKVAMDRILTYGDNGMTSDTYYNPDGSIFETTDIYYDAEGKESYGVKISADRDKVQIWQVDSNGKHSPSEFLTVEEAEAKLGQKIKHAEVLKPSEPTTPATTPGGTPKTQPAGSSANPKTELPEVSEKFANKFSKAKSINDLNNLVSEAKTPEECDYIVAKLQSSNPQVNRVQIQEVINFARFKADNLRAAEQSGVSTDFKLKFMNCETLTDIEILVTNAETSAECDYIVEQLNNRKLELGDQPGLQQTIDLAKFRADRLRIDEQNSTPVQNIQTPRTQTQTQQSRSPLGESLSNPSFPTKFDKSAFKDWAKAQGLTVEFKGNMAIFKNANGQTVRAISNDYNRKGYVFDDHITIFNAQGEEIGDVAKYQDNGKLQYYYDLKDGRATKMAECREDGLWYDHDTNELMDSNPLTGELQSRPDYLRQVDNANTLEELNALKNQVETTDELNYVLDKINKLTAAEGKSRIEADTESGSSHADAAKLTPEQQLAKIVETCGEPKKTPIGPFGKVTREIYTDSNGNQLALVERNKDGSIGFMQIATYETPSSRPQITTVGKHAPLSHTEIEKVSAQEYKEFSEYLNEKYPDDAEGNARILRSFRRFPDGTKKLESMLSERHLFADEIEALAEAMETNPDACTRLLTIKGKRPTEHSTYMGDDEGWRHYTDNYKLSPQTVKILVETEVKYPGVIEQIVNDPVFNDLDINPNYDITHDNILEFIAEGYQKNPQLVRDIRIKTKDSYVSNYTFTDLVKTSITDPEGVQLFINDPNIKNFIFENRTGYNQLPLDNAIAAYKKDPDLFGKFAVDTRAEYVPDLIDAYKINPNLTETLRQDANGYSPQQIKNMVVKAKNNPPEQTQQAESVEQTHQTQQAQPVKGSVAKCEIPSSMPQTKATIGDVTVTVAGGDMTTVKADAYVVPEFRSAASDDSGVGGAVARRGAKAGMDAYNEHIEQNGKMEFGDVVLTESGGGATSHLLHAATAGADADTAFEVVQRAVYNALVTASENGLQSVVIPAMQTGIIGHLTNEQSAQATLAAINQFAQSGGKMDVSVVVYSRGQGLTDFNNVLASKSYENATPVKGTKEFNIGDFVRERVENRPPQMEEAAPSGTAQETPAAQPTATQTVQVGEAFEALLAKNDSKIVRSEYFADRDIKVYYDAEGNDVKTEFLKGGKDVIYTEVNFSEPLENGVTSVQKTEIGYNVKVAKPKVQIFDKTQEFDSGYLEYNFDGTPERATYVIDGKNPNNRDSFIIFYENGKEAKYVQRVYSKEGGYTEITADLQTGKKTVIIKDKNYAVTQMSETGLDEEPVFMTKDDIIRRGADVWAAFPAMKKALADGQFDCQGAKDFIETMREKTAECQKIINLKKPDGTLRFTPAEAVNVIINCREYLSDSVLMQLITTPLANGQYRSPFEIWQGCRESENSTVSQTGKVAGTEASTSATASPSSVEATESPSLISRLAEKWKNFKFPYRLSSKLHDNFHITGNQVMIRAYCEAVADGLTREQMLEKFFDVSKLSESEIQEAYAWMDRTREMISDIDKSFKRVIPALTPEAYYRGVTGTPDERYIQVLQNANVGDVIVPDLGYSWLTPKMSYAEDYAGYISENNGRVSSPETSYVIIWKTPAGARLSRDINLGEFEVNPYSNVNVVTQRAVQGKVLKKEVKNGRTYITLQYLGQGKNPPSITPAGTSTPSPAVETASATEGSNWLRKTATRVKNKITGTKTLESVLDAARTDGAVVEDLGNGEYRVTQKHKLSNGKTQPVGNGADEYDIQTVETYKEGSTEPAETLRYCISMGAETPVYQKTVRTDNGYIHSIVDRQTGYGVEYSGYDKEGNPIENVPQTVRIIGDGGRVLREYAGEDIELGLLAPRYNTTDDYSGSLLSVRSALSIYGFRSSIVEWQAYDGTKHLVANGQVFKPERFVRPAAEADIKPYTDLKTSTHAFESKMAEYNEYARTRNLTIEETKRSGAPVLQFKNDKGQVVREVEAYVDQMEVRTDTFYELTNSGEVRQSVVKNRHGDILKRTLTEFRQWWGKASTITLDYETGKAYSGLYLDGKLTNPQTHDLDTGRSLFANIARTMR